MKRLAEATSSGGRDGVECLLLFLGTLANAIPQQRQFGSIGSPAAASLLGFLGAASPPKPPSRGSVKGAWMPNPRPASIQSQDSVPANPAAPSSSGTSQRSPAKSHSKLGLGQQEVGSASSRQGSKPTVWESLWSVDHTVNLENGNGKK